MKKIFLFLLVIFSFLILARIIIDADKSDKSNITIQPSTTPSIAIEKQELTGWFAAWSSERADEALPGVVEKFKTYSPMLYRIMADGSLGRHDISNWDEIVNYGRTENIPIAPVITDESGTQRVQKLLVNDLAQKQFIAALVSEAKRENFSGWSIDFEKITAKDKKAFSNFVKNLSIELHKNNLKLYMIAYGRDADETYDPALAHDYQVFGSYADQVQLMIYYYSNEYTDPGGQTPLADYRSVLKYALENIPREKILIGLSTYGNDWAEGQEEVEGMGYEQVKQRIDEEKADISYSRQELSMVARYTKNGVDHTLMYENAMTILEKMKIAREEFGINKFAFWSLGNEDPELWEKL